MGVLALLTRVAGLSPFIARPISIACAMIAGWLCHRSWTFVVTTPPTLVEFARYAAVAWGAAAINYALYAAILFASPALAPEAALGLSSLAAMATSYLGMRFGVFTR